MTRIGGWLGREPGRLRAQDLVKMARLSAGEWGMGTVLGAFGGFAVGERYQAHLPLLLQTGEILLGEEDDPRIGPRIRYDTASGQLTLTGIYYEQGRNILRFSSDPGSLPGLEPIQALPAGKSALFVWKKTNR